MNLRIDLKKIIFICCFVTLFNNQTMPFFEKFSAMYQKTMSFLEKKCKTTMQETREFPFDEKLFFVDHCKRMQHEAEEGLRTALQVPDDVWADFIKEVRETEEHTRNVLLKTKRSNFFHDPKIPKELLDRTCALLEKYGIEPTSIDIKVSNDNSHFAAVKKSNELLLNLSAFQAYSVDVQEAVIAHEIGHLLHADNPITVDIFRKNIFRFFPENELKNIRSEAALILNNPERIDNLVKNNIGLYFQDKTALDCIKNNAEHLNGLLVKFNPLLWLFGKSNELYNVTLEMLTMILLLEKSNKSQSDAVGNWFDTHREYIADQYIASRDVTMINKRMKQFTYDYTDKQLRLTGRPSEYYPSLLERFVAFFNNVVRPKYYLHFLARFFDESSI